MNKKWLILIISNIILAGISGILYGTSQNQIETEDVYFYSSSPDHWEQIDTNITLHGRFYYPPGFQNNTQYPLLIMFHGASSNLNSHNHFAPILAHHGILCFTIDFRGHGESTGSFPFENGLLYNATFGDVMATYRYLQNQTYFNASRTVAYGISLGGGAALYMALMGLIPNIVLWYPGTAYIWGNTPIYQHNVTSPDFKGLVFLGTNDECVRCNPEYMVHFASRHPTVQLYWLDGASHVDSRFYSETVEITTNYLIELWNLPTISWWNTSVQNGSISIAILIPIGGIDLGLLGIHLYRKRIGSRV